MSDPSRVGSAGTFLETRSGGSIEQSWEGGHRIVGATLPEPGHEADSDDFGWAALATHPDQRLVAVVCDGVGSSLRKAEASRLAVQSVLAWAQDPPDVDDFEGALAGVVMRAHAAVRDELQGAGLSTIVAVLVDRAEQRLAWASVGDSAIYLRAAAGFRKLNTEDKAARPRMQNGRPVLVNGVPFMDHGLTQALGQLEDVHPQTGELSYAPGALLALASDGIKEPYVPDFLREQGELARAAEVLAFCERMRRTDKIDDSTFVLLQLGDAEETLGFRARIEAYVAADASERERILAEAESGERLHPDPLVACLDAEGDERRAARLIALLEASPVPPSPERWVALLDAAARAGRRATVQRLSAAAARARTRAHGPREPTRT